MWYKGKFYKYATAIIMILVIIFMLSKIDFFLSPFRRFLATIFYPILATVFLYYICRPLVKLFMKIRLPKWAAILATFVIVIAFIVFTSTYTSSILTSQLNQLVRDFPKSYEWIKQATRDLMDSPWHQYINFEDLQNKLISFAQNFTRSLTSITFNFLSRLANFGTALFTVPFMLYYFLKDDLQFKEYILKLVPDKHAQNIRTILKDVDTALSSYITGQLIVASAIGVMMFIGFSIIRLKYPLVMAIFAAVACIIPYFGPWIGIIPAAFVSLSEGPVMLLKVIIVMLVVQQIDNNFISPQIMGKNLNIHPVTVILLLLGGSSLFGLLGLIIIIPSYAAVKAVALNVYRMYLSKYVKKEA
ncbi:AI-2E family transporter [Pseudoclostridium thermosuccinogenes]|jgi:predicted PurR-regulated permease PerM|nr:AI-2E family transporter [Pseudoclostridium thermosuccinogenes]